MLRQNNAIRHSCRLALRALCDLDLGIRAILIEVLASLAGDLIPD
jgi:hypothetical protein